MGQPVLVHFAAPWEMDDERNPGQKRRGFSLQFITPYEEGREGALGFRGTKTSVSDEAVYVALRKVGLPCMAELEFGVKPGADGKLAAVVTGVSKAQPVKLFQPVAA